MAGDHRGAAFLFVVWLYWCNCHRNGPAIGEKQWLNNGASYQGATGLFSQPLKKLINK